MNYVFHKCVLVVVIQMANNTLMVMIMKISRKQPGESGYRKTLDDLEGSLDFPPPTISTENNKMNKNNIVAPPDACPKGHFLKTSGGDCIFCRNWLEQIDKAFSGVPNKMGAYKRQDIGADYGGSGTLG